MKSGLRVAPSVSIRTDEMVYAMVAKNKTLHTPHIRQEKFQNFVISEETLQYSSLHNCGENCFLLLEPLTKVTVTYL